MHKHENQSAWEAHCSAMREKQALLRGKQRPVIGCLARNHWRWQPAVEVYYGRTWSEKAIQAVLWIGSGLSFAGCILMLLAVASLFE